MSPTETNPLARVAAIIPALDEAEALAALLPALARLPLGQMIVCDNGSTDNTRQVIERFGATWVFEPKRGYGAACYAGMDRLADSIDIVAFVDADQSRDVPLLASLVEPIARNEADFVIGARVRELRETAAATLAQRFGNWLMPKLIRWGWGHTFADLGPFRAIRRCSLEAMGMRDRAYGWTIEMQIRAVELGLRIRELRVPHRRRVHGRDKICGSVRGVALATYWIIRTCAWLWLTKSRRLRSENAAQNGTGTGLRPVQSGSQRTTR